MRYLPTSRLTPGMALGQDIYDGAGRLLLGRHILLTEEQISNLEFLGFPGAYVDDEFSRGIEIQQIVSPEVRRQALKIMICFTWICGSRNRRKRSLSCAKRWSLWSMM